MKLMKQLNTINLIFSLFLMLFFCACKKYPEDGKWSKNTVKDRLLNRWELKECLVNNVDSIDAKYTLIQNNTCDLQIDTLHYSLRNIILEFKYYTTKSGGLKEKHYSSNLNNANILNTTASNACISVGNVSDFELSKHKNGIQFKNEILEFPYFVTNSNYKTRILFSLNNNKWEIRKLTDKELILETTNTFNEKIKLKFNRL